MEQKVDILSMIEKAKDKGVSITRACALWRIERRRVVRWRRKEKDGQCLENLKPGPRYPSHKLLPEEKTAVLQMAKKEEYADLSQRMLAVTAWNVDMFFVSFSSVYRILRAANMMAMRGIHKPHNGRAIPPDRKEITEPISDGVGISVICQPMREGFSSICICSWMNTPGKLSHGLSAGTKRLLKPDISSKRVL